MLDLTDTCVKNSIALVRVLDNTTDSPGDLVVSLIIHKDSFRANHEIITTFGSSSRGGLI